ncbi:MAG: Stk1 family PASTA domain-containing Ser/Thr kinase [Clostridium sp.]|nr:Stk1 family PASTA domain-containing Ser/Thr kinase [Clostridium sp.]
MIGEILGNRYELLEKIGEGGMSVVYKARCNKLHRNVAVKILKKELSGNEDIVNKFKREATAIATLSDNNIVNVLDVGTQDDLNYIVMEYVKGNTLKDMIREFGKLNYETTIKIGLQIAKALECAHKNNIIHRDVKPQNVLVTDDGVIKVTDFGIAKSTDSATLTNTTTIMGSAQYFSPEQAKGSFVDARTDIYSLGVVLYEMATGKLPFEADSPVTIALKHIQEEAVPPKQVNSRVPESLNKLILKCMEKDANKRYQTAKELITDLQKIKEDPNAVIDAVEEDYDGKTIVMTAVNPAPGVASNKKDVIEDEHASEYDDEYDDDEYDDEYDDDEYDDEYDDYDDEEEDGKKSSKSNKNIKKIIVGIIAAIAVVLLAVGGVSLLSGSSKEEVTIPTIKGKTLDDAKAAIEGVGLVLEEGDREESDEAEGTILDVYPNEGSKLEKGSKVRVIVSSGKKKIKVPSLENESLSDAEAILKKNGLTNYEVAYKNNDNVDKGCVISTDPSANSEVTEKDKITIYVSSGSSVKYAKVPSINNMSSGEAQSALSNVGLGVSVQYKDVTDESQNGVVLYSSPGAGSTVTQGKTVTITVGRYKAPEKTPSDENTNSNNGSNNSAQTKPKDDNNTNKNEDPKGENPKNEDPKNENPKNEDPKNEKPVEPTPTPSKNK